MIEVLGISTYSCVLNFNFTSMATVSTLFIKIVMTFAD